MRITVRAVLFDLDGVLADSTDMVSEVWRTWAGERGLDPEEVVSVAHGRPTRELIRTFTPHLSSEEEARTIERIEVEAGAAIEAIPGAVELLRALPPQSWAVVTSGTVTLARSRIDAIGAKSPRVLVTADDVHRGKPDPEGYLRAAAALGAEAEECVVIEDSPAGVDAARAAGMAVIGVTTTYPTTELARADAVVDTLEAVRVARVASSEARPALELEVRPEGTRPLR
jgi:sugar-phosphatase